MPSRIPSSNRSTARYNDGTRSSSWRRRKVNVVKVNAVPELSKAAIRRALAGQFNLSNTRNKFYPCVRAYEKEYLVRVLKNGKCVLRADAPRISVFGSKRPEEWKDFKKTHTTATFTRCYNV